MSTQPPSGSGQPDDDPFRKPPPTPPPGGGSPYDTPPRNPYDGPPADQPPPYGGGPYGGGYGSDDPLAGMPPLADSGKRVLARIIDLILVGIVSALIAWAFGVAKYQTNPDKIHFTAQFGESVIAAILYMGYDTILMTRTGQTLGKKLMKLRVANLSDGATPTAQTNLVRAAVLWIPAVFCCACIWTAISGGWSFFDKPYKQGLHDKAAKTVVVSTA
ncbi:RDD family protein [Streptomyces beihaiensis]|uniref:RDD family protein n=1 Tax=Streptomyces beihaiensis TaxID=2984495 RepID=A0ABT3U3X1_9ACTN|nr:RDD family protein [Streptomyces beihaiensis]MCX3063993.1 RDD family protein [Streptomyces beihaiensis]